MSKSQQCSDFMSIAGTPWCSFHLFIAQVPPPTRTDLVHQALADQILFHPAAGCDGNFTELEGLISRNFIVLGIAGRMLQRYTIYTVIIHNNTVHIVYYSEHTLPTSTRGLHLPLFSSFRPTKNVMMQSFQKIGNCRCLVVLLQQVGWNWSSVS